MSPMQYGAGDDDDTSSDDSTDSSDSYTSMSPLQGVDGKPIPRSHSLEMLLDDSSKQKQRNLMNEGEFAKSMTVSTKNSIHYRKSDSSTLWGVGSQGKVRPFYYA